MVCVNCRHGPACLRLPHYIIARHVPDGNGAVLEHHSHKLAVARERRAADARAEPRRHLMPHRESDRVAQNGVAVGGNRGEDATVGGGGGEHGGVGDVEALTRAAVGQTGRSAVPELHVAGHAACD